MPLTLHVISHHSRSMGAAATCQISEPGGSIGRIDGNDWVLPDPERFVSSTHAQLSCEDGVWYLTDKSTNGTFVNDPGNLIGGGGTIPINDGDRIFVGDYEIMVSIAGATTTGPVDSAILTGPPLTDPSLPGAGQSLDPLAGFGAASPAPGGNLDPLAGFGGPAGGGPPTQGDPFGGAPDADPDPFGAPPAQPDPFGASPAQPDPFGTPPAQPDPFGTPPAQPDPFGATATPGQFGAPAGDDELDPLAAFDSLDSPPSVPQNTWPQDAGATSDHGSAMDENFSPPAASSGSIGDDWDDTSFAPSAPATPPPAPPQPAAPAPRPAATAPATPPPAPAPPRPAAQPQAQPPQAPAPAGYPGAAAPPAQSGVYPSVGQSQPPPLDAAVDGSGLSLLLSAMGVDPNRMPPQAAAAVFQLSGQVFREVVQGMMEVLQARDKLKSELRISRTVIQPVKNNPLKFSVTTDEAVEKLLFPNNQGYMAPVEAIHEAIDDIKAHQMAMMAGLRASIDSIMEQFSPDEMERKFEKALKRNTFAGLMGKSKYWDMYKEMYQDMAGDSADSVLRLFGEDFASAYQSQLDKL